MANKLVSTIGNRYPKFWIFINWLLVWTSYLPKIKCQLNKVANIFIMCIIYNIKFLLFLLSLNNLVCIVVTVMSNCNLQLNSITFVLSLSILTMLSFEASYQKGASAYRADKVDIIIQLFLVFPAKVVKTLD